MRLKHLLSVFLTLLTLSVGQMWGTLPNNPKWTATALADIADDATVIIMSSSDYALPSTTTSSSPAKISCTISTTNGISTITPASGTLQNLAWTVAKLTSSWKFYQEGSNSIHLYLSGTGSNTALRVGSGSSNDQFVMGSSGKLLKVTTANRYVGPYSGGSDWRTYNSETHENYNSATLTFYVLNTGGGNTPTLTPNTSSLDWTTVNKGANLSTKTFTISGSNLTGNLSVSATGGYTVSCGSSITVTNGAPSVTSITVTPPSTLTAGTKNGTITISGGGLTSSVSVTCSLTVNEIDQFIDDVQSTDGYTSASPHIEAGSYGSTPSLSHKTATTSGSCEQQHYHFMGWITAAKYEAGTSIADGDLKTPTSATGETYYAVWAKQAAGGSSNTISLTYSDFGYTGTTYSTKSVTKGGFGFTCKQGCRSNSPYSLQMNSSKTGHLYNTTAITGLQSVTLKCNATNTGQTATVYQGSSAETTTSSAGTAACKASKNYTVNITSGSYFTIAVSGATYFSEIVIAYSTVTYEDYIAKCCTPLGSINGSVSFTNVSPTSVTVGVPSEYSDKDNANLEGYIFKRYAASTGGDALETIETDAANKTTATFNTGLVANTTYYYTIIAKHSSSSCNSTESARSAHTITSYVVSYAAGDGSGTNPGAHPAVLSGTKVELKSNSFTAPAGKDFVNWNDGNKGYDEGEEYTVTENTVMTAQWQCMEPGFTKNLSTTQVNYLQGETAAKLSVTAAANGAELSYQWQMSPNGTSGWDNVGTNSNEYTPSTATAGDQYYHCLVTNLADGCTESKATSAVAHIHVDVPAACLEPVISVASDTYYEDKSVTITCGTVGAAIYYTTDGSTTPTSGSTLYEGAITVDHSMTIKAIAIKAGMDNSTVAEATYTIKCETPTIVLAAGNYTGVQTTTITKGYGTKIYYTTDGSTPSNTNGTEYTGAVSIDQPMTLKAIVWKDGCTNSEVASAAYTLKCTTPTFNKETGTYTGAQSITLSSTAGADIYYTLDGTAPSKTNGTKYTAAIEVSANQTVKAIAVKEGWGDSEIASATYTIQYNVYWWVNGVAWTGKGGSTLVTYGQTATAPTTTPTKADGCGDKFMGWTETQNYENDNTAPVDMFTETSAAITKETNFYAVFADYGE